MATVNLSTANGSYNGVVDFNIEYIDDDEIDKATFVMNEGFAINSGDEVLFYDDDDVLQFAGKLKDKNPLSGDSVGLVELVCYTYDIELTEQTVTDVFQNVTLESFVETIVETYSSLTFATTLNTGITIDYYVADKKYAIDVIRDIITRSPDLSYQINYTTKVFTLIQKGSTTSSISLIHNTNCMFETGWKSITDKQVTRLNLTGGKEVRNGFSQSFNGDGTTAEFTLTYIPSNVKIVVGGTEQDLEVSGQNTGDFTVVPKEKKIIFNSGSIPASGTNNIVVTYDFEIPIDLTGMDADYSLIQQYGVIEKSITRNHLKSVDDAIAYGYEYVNKWAKPVYGNKALIISTLDASQVRCGDKIYVEDTGHTIEGATIIGYYMIKSVVYSYEGLVIEVGDIRSQMIDFVKELKYEIQQLEGSNTNISITTKVQTVLNQAQITVTPSLRMVRRTYDADTFYWQEVGGTRNDWREDGTGQTFREVGGFTDELVTIHSLTTESGDILITEGGDSLIE